MDIQKEGEKNEEVVADYYRRQGFRVWRVNDRGFPDLIVLNKKEVAFLVEVKALGHDVHQHQVDFLKKLKAEGFETKVAIVKDGKILEEI